METKFCSRGKHEVDVALFSKNGKTKDGLFRWCKPCMAEYERERYHNGDKARKQKNKRQTIVRAREYVWSVLTTSSCIDCGEDDPLVLEFDHQSDKKYNVSEMMWGHSVEKIKQEIAKCEIRCANCHKRKTAKDFGFWRTFEMPT